MFLKSMKKYPILDYVLIAIGAALMAVGIGVFLVDAKVVPGGVSGLSMAIYYLTGLPVGMMIWVLNIPLYLWGLKELGKTFGIRTFYGFTLNSFFIDLFRGAIPGFSYIRLQDNESVKYLLNHDFFFFILIGTVLLGVGLGIIFKCKGTTAGSDIVAAILNKRWGIKPGNAIILIDFFVISIAGIIIYVKNLGGDRPALVLTCYSIFLLFVSSRLIDMIIDGFDYARAVYIFSEKTDEIANSIMYDFNRGATAVKTTGLYTNTDRDLLVTIVTNKEISGLLEEIKRKDPAAFVIVNNVHEVLGEGFRRRI